MKHHLRKALPIILTTSIGLTCTACEKKGLPKAYSQLDKGVVTEVTRQGSGGCWAFAADASIHTSSIIRDGKDPEIKPIDIMKDCYQVSDEGYHFDGDVNSTPGDNTMVVFGLSDGLSDGTCVVTEAPFLSGYDSRTMEYENFVTADQVKEMIRDKGGASTGICFVNANFYGMSNGYMGLYKDPDTEGELHHSICLVGWDDGFDKENFGEEFGKKLPNKDGAWLAKDSMGPEYGNDGYFWISYESQMAFGSVFYTTDKYSEVVAYDGGCMDAVKLGENESIGANVFHHEGRLSAVGTYVGVHGFAGDEGEPGFIFDREALSITIEIRDEKMEKVLATKKAEFALPGYYVIELDAPIEVTDYSIVVHYENAVPIESEHPEKHHGLYYVAGCESGQSYLYCGDQWMDTADPETKETLGLADAPNNCCIKALYVD